MTYRRFVTVMVVTGLLLQMCLSVSRAELRTFDRPDDRGQIALLAYWSGVRLSTDRLFPRRDKYLDRVVIKASLSGDVVRSELQIRYMDGAFNRRVPFGRLDEGRVRLKWDGRTARGSIVPAGDYVVRLVAEDRRGRTTKSPFESLAVFHRVLTRVVVERDVGAWSSLFKRTHGECRRVRESRRGGSVWRDGVALRTCSGTSAIGWHELHLRSGIKRMGPLSINAYGGGSSLYPTEASLGYVTGLYRTRVGSRTRLGNRTKWHQGKVVGLEDYLDGRLLTWRVRSVSGNQYDVAEFRVRAVVWVFPQ